MRARNTLHLKITSSKLLLLGVCVLFWLVHVTILEPLKQQIASTPHHHSTSSLATPMRLQYKKSKVEIKTFENEIMAFIRIPKTGSTSLLNFLTRTANQNYNNMLSDSYWSSMSDRRLGMYSCMFVNTSAFNGTLHRERNNPQCAHANHGELLSAFAGSLSDVRNSSNATVIPPLQTFTVVREPFHRLRSFFYYMRLSVNGSQWGRPSFTEDQYKQVVNGDFPRWLELLWKQKSPFDMQYEYLDRNATTAIEMMENGTVHVYVNECFEASLRLMTERYGFGDVDAILKDSIVIQANTNKNRYASLYTKEELAKLHENAKLWFADEYRFYESAVLQFQRQFLSSSLPHLNCSASIL